MTSITHRGDSTEPLRGISRTDPGEAIISDEELTELALSADCAAPVDDTVEPWHWGVGFQNSLLPDWYMPRPTASRRGTGTKIVVGILVGGLLIIGAFGLCITSGFLSLA